MLAGEFIAFHNSTYKFAETVNKRESHGVKPPIEPVGTRSRAAVWVKIDIYIAPGNVFLSLNRLKLICYN